MNCDASNMVVAALSGRPAKRADARACHLLLQVVQRGAEVDVEDLLVDDQCRD